MKYLSEDLMKLSISPIHFPDYFDPNSENLSDKQRKQLACEHLKTKEANHGRMTYCVSCDKVLGMF